jgi:hypothetical protein
MRLRIAAIATGAAVLGARLVSAAPADASYEHLSISVDKHVLRGSRDSIHGRIKPASRDRVVWVYAAGPGIDGWRRVAKPKTDKHGRFKASWRPPAVGRYAIQALLTGSDAPPRRRSVTVYKVTSASWYGPGFYGHRTACGQTLARGTLGVAHRTLPCGTRVALYNHGYHVTVQVIDRGPYVAGREYDLTEATKERLRFGSTGTLWAAPGV